MGLTVNRQMAKKSTVNRQKRNIFYFQPSNERAKISPQISFFKFLLNNFFLIFVHFFIIFIKQFSLNNFLNLFIYFYLFLFIFIF